MKSPNNNLLNEELTKVDVDKQIKAYLSTADFKSVIEKIVKEKLKSEPELENKMVEISKNAMTQLFKALYTKRTVWRNNIVNKSS